MQRIKKFDIFANDRVAVGFAFDILGLVFGVAITPCLPEMLIQVGFGPFIFYIVIGGKGV